jgi:hypothetical protein
MSKSSIVHAAALLVLITVPGVLLLSSTSHGVGSAQAAPAKGDDSSLIERGKYLVLVAGCNDCHTPTKMGPNGPTKDWTRMLSGTPEGMPFTPPPKPDGSWIWFGDPTATAFAGPWGVSYAINLTPDMETGTGAWTPEVFIAAVKSGKHMGKGEPILPPMPWEGIGQMKEDDLRAIFAYLHSVPPIRNQAPTHQMAPMGK